MHEKTRYVVRGELRRKVLLALDKPSTPTILSKRLGANRASVPRTILYLSELGLLKCINPEDKRGRLYVVTAQGKSVTQDIVAMEGENARI